MYNISWHTGFLLCDTWGKKLLSIFVFDFHLTFVSYRMKPLNVTWQQKYKPTEHGMYGS